MGKPQLRDLAPGTETFLKDVLEGLSQDPKTLPCKYFYDEYGSKLFERICRMDEYYLTRTEEAILNKHVTEMADALGPGCMVLEPGSGSGEKASFLLKHLKSPVAFVPIEISKESLVESAGRIDDTVETVEVLPICADFHWPFELPKPKKKVRRRVLFFPGSTFGNFEWETAKRFLERFVEVVGPGGGMLIGIDLRKDRAILERAYSDAQGITASFNLNILRRINQDLDGRFDLRRFEHRALYNEEKGRIEMHLVSLSDQEVRVGDETFAFRKGETICTEYSYKYDLDGFARLIGETGGRVERVWTDDKRYFAVVFVAIPER